MLNYIRQRQYNMARQEFWIDVSFEGNNGVKSTRVGATLTITYIYGSEWNRYLQLRREKSEWNRYLQLRREKVKRDFKGIIYF